MAGLCGIGRCADLQDEQFAQPYEEYREDRSPNGLGFHDGESDGVQGPPGYAIPQECQQCHSGCAKAEKSNSFPVGGVKGLHLSDPVVEDPRVRAKFKCSEVIRACFIAQIQCECD